MCTIIVFISFLQAVLLISDAILDDIYEDVRLLVVVVGGGVGVVVAVSVVVADSMASEIISDNNPMLDVVDDVDPNIYDDFIIHVGTVDAAAAAADDDDEDTFDADEEEQDPLRKFSNSSTSISDSSAMSSSSSWSSLQKREE